LSCPPDREQPDGRCDATTHDKDLRPDEIDLLPALFYPPIEAKYKKRRTVFESIVEVSGPVREHRCRGTNEVAAGGVAFQARSLGENYNLSASLVLLH
jgi:hypothetical protein